MRSFERDGEDRHHQLQRLRDDLQGAIVTAEAQGYILTDRWSFGKRELQSGAEQEIIAANRLLRDTRKKREPSWDGDTGYMLIPLPKDSALADQEHNWDHESWLDAFGRAERERRRDRLSKEDTPKEQDILEFLRHRCKTEKGGLTPEQAIAAEFGMAHSTARVHVRNIKQKHGA